jgi:hypothetical protein
MLERLGRLAEGLATGVGTSRRGFLGRLGRTALGAAGALGALAVASSAQTSSVVCCTYQCKRYSYYRHNGHPHSITFCMPAGSTCLKISGYCHLQHTSTASDCSQC